MSEVAREQERRKDVRQRVVHRAKVVYGEGSFSVDCFIRNLSVGGARITLAKGIDIPRYVYLIDIPSGLAHEVEVVSIRSPSLGLRIIRTHELEELTDPTLKFLKLLWMGCAR